MHLTFLTPFTNTDLGMIIERLTHFNEAPDGTNTKVSEGQESKLRFRTLSDKAGDEESFREKHRKGFKMNTPKPHFIPLPDGKCKRQFPEVLWLPNHTIGVLVSTCVFVRWVPN